MHDNANGDGGVVAYNYLGNAVPEQSGFWHPLRRRKVVFLSAAATTCLLAAIVLSILPRSYMADAAVTVSGQPPLVGSNAPGLAEKLGDEADLQSQILIIKSPRLLGSILAEPATASALMIECDEQQSHSLAAPVMTWFGLGSSCETILGRRETAIDWLTQHLSVSVVGRSRVVNIGYRSAVPSVAAQVANALAAAYLQDKQQEVSGSRGVAVQWLRTELARRGDDLRNSEMAVENYRRQHGLERGQSAPIVSEQLSGLAKELAAAVAKKADAAAALQQLGPDPSNLDHAMQSRPVLESRTISELRIRRAAVGTRIAHLAATWGKNSQLLDILQQEQAQIDRELGNEVTRIAASIRQANANATQEVAMLEQQLDSLKRNVGDAGNAEAAIAGMVQTAQVQREIYLDLAKKANDLETERRILTGDAQLVNYAETPIHVWFPKPTVFAALSIVLALTVGTGTAFLWDRWDRTVRAEGVLEAAVGLPVFSRIPEASRSPGSLLAMSRSDRPSALQEAVRTLYANCLLLPREHAPRTILVTSAEPGEGKTFVTLTLAAFAAAAGKRVLAIENDLRQPGFAQALKLRPGKGLADLLRGTAEFDSVLQRDKSNGFDVIQAGSAVVNSTELVSSPAMQRVIAIAASRYDLILFDSPPSLVMMDARILASHVDCVLFCARWGKSELYTVVDGIKGLQESGGRIAGLVLDRVDPAEYKLYGGNRTVSGPYISRAKA